MNRKKLLIGLGLLVVLAGLAYANLGLKRPSGVSVTVEKIQPRDLESIVSASGKVQPRRLLTVDNETAGKVVRLAVREGDVVTTGQLLLEIDPTLLQTNVRNREASLESAKSQLTQLFTQVENAKVALNQAQENLKRAEAQAQAGLLARDQFERAQNDVKIQTANLRGAEQSALTQQQRIKQEESGLSTAQFDFTKVKVLAPIDGIVTRRLIEEGETARFGMGVGSDLVEIADMSGVQAEIEVDETDVPFIKIGQVAKITVDALPDQSLIGRVTEVGNSPIQTGAAAAGRATNFKVKVTIDGRVPGVRPGFTCTAVITTATRQKAVAVPIGAMTVRELIVDAEGNVVKPEGPAVPGSARPTAPVEPKEGQSRKEIEGVFVAREGKAVFVPVKLGIAGERHFEVLSGLKEGDEVITGPFASVRNLKEGDVVKVTTGATAPGPGGA